MSLARKNIISSLLVLFLASPSFAQNDSISEYPDDTSKKNRGGFYTNALMIDAIRPASSNIALSFDKKLSGTPFGFRTNFSWSFSSDLLISNLASNSKTLNNILLYSHLYHVFRNTFKWTSSIQTNYYFMDQPSVGIYLSFLGGIAEYEAVWVTGQECLHRTPIGCARHGDITTDRWTYIYMLGLGAGVEFSLSEHWFINADLQLGLTAPMEQHGEHIEGVGEGFMFFNSIDIGYRF